MAAPAFHRGWTTAGASRLTGELAEFTQLPWTTFSIAFLKCLCVFFGMDLSGHVFHHTAEPYENILGQCNWHLSTLKGTLPYLDCKWCWSCAWGLYFVVKDHLWVIYLFNKFCLCWLTFENVQHLEHKSWSEVHTAINIGQIYGKGFDQTLKFKYCIFCPGRFVIRTWNYESKCLDLRATVQKSGVGFWKFLARLQSFQKCNIEKYY